MGKAKRATRKELEEVIGEMIQEISALKVNLMNLGTFLTLYIEWKGDKIEFPEWLRKRTNKVQTETKTTDSKDGKRDRYRKITQPL